MRHSWLIFIAFIALVSLVAPSFAEDGFYVEVGGDMTKKDAQKQWDELSKTYKTLLGKLHFFPKTIMQDGNAEKNTRIQAGPIATKEKAQKICTKLFKRNVPCFVIEGLGDTPPKTVMNLSEQSMHPTKYVQLPWLEASAPPPAPIQELPVASSQAEIANLAPAAGGDKAKQKKADAQAEVKVAEAIRVPLTEGEYQQKNARVVVKALPNIKPTTLAGDAPYPDESNDSGAGWLMVTAFPDEEIANEFWEEIRAGSPKQANKLRVRTIKPLSGDQAKTSLNLGPFASSSEAYDFCRHGVQARDRGLSCSFSNIEPGGRVNVQVASADRSEAYNMMHHASRRRPVENPLANLSPAAGGPAKRQYWIQVASADSQIEALHKWEEIKTKIDDLMQGLRSSISTSVKDPNLFVVRVGPIEKNDDAIKACDQMHDRSIECRVILYSTSAR